MLPDHHGLITTVWILLHALPLALVIAAWVLFGALWGLPLLILYVIGLVPYGFFFSIPTMIKLFHKPATLHKR
jgi:hypothetical protein